MGNVVDLDKVQAARERIEANPNLLDRVNAELKEMFEALGIELTGAERQFLLMDLVTKVENRLNVGCGAGCMM